MHDNLLPELTALVAVTNRDFESETDAVLATGPLLARLKAANRAANEASRVAKQRTSDARLSMDHTQLGLQNLLYEKRYLESEIEKCRQFASIYEDIPLHDLDEFVQLAPPEASTPAVLENEHQLMLNRLSFELAERQRLDERKKALSARRDQLLKEVKDQQTKLDTVAQQFDNITKTALELQKLMQSMTVPVTETVAPAQASQ